MGGEYPSSVKAERPDVPPHEIPSSEQKSSDRSVDVEMHLSGAEVHFHDRTNGTLKVALRVSDFYNVRERLKRNEVCYYVDVVNKSRLKIQLRSYRQRGACDLCDCDMTIERIEIGQNLLAIENFAARVQK